MFEWGDYHYFYQAQLKFSISFSCKLKQQTLVSAVAVDEVVVLHHQEESQKCSYPTLGAGVMAFVFISGPRVLLR